MFEMTELEISNPDWCICECCWKGHWDTPEEKSEESEGSLKWDLCEECWNFSSGLTESGKPSKLECGTCSKYRHEETPKGTGETLPRSLSEVSLPETPPGDCSGTLPRSLSGTLSRCRSEKSLGWVLPETLELD